MRMYLFNATDRLLRLQMGNTYLNLPPLNFYELKPGDDRALGVNATTKAMIDQGLLEVTASPPNPENFNPRQRSMIKELPEQFRPDAAKIKHPGVKVEPIKVSVETVEAKVESISGEEVSGGKAEPTSDKIGLDVADGEKGEGETQKKPKPKPKNKPKTEAKK